MRDNEILLNLKVNKTANAEAFKCDVGDIVQINLQQYLYGVVASQIGNANIQACKAQAIAARTTAYPYYSTSKMINDNAPQCFNANRVAGQYPNAYNAVNQTDGLLVCYNGIPCQPCSFSVNNGGKTTSSKQRWGTYKEWLIEKNDPWDSPPKKGTGVGMSQIGAKNMATAGKTYKQILSFYYDGTYLLSMEQEVQHMKVSVNNFLEQTNYIRDHFNSKTKYQNGMSGQLVNGYYRTDCRGLIVWALRRCGMSYSCVGTNYMSRNQIEKFIPLNGKTTSLIPGMLVFKAYSQSDAKYNLAQKYKKGGQYYNQTIGLLDVYHVGIVISASPLAIYHWGTGKTDTVLGNWKYAGKLNCIDYDNKQEVSDMSKQIMVSTSGGTLNMRSAASKTAAVVAKIPNGTKLTAIEQSGDFYKVTYSSKTGYIMKEFTTQVASTASDVVTLTLSRAVAEDLLKALTSAL